MFIWMAINVDEQLNKFKQKVVDISNQLNFNNYCLNLPLHISLKISFEVNDEIADGVITDIEKYYSTLDEFSIKIKQVEKQGEIIWIRMGENNTLVRIHNDFNEILLSKYSVVPHQYDLDYVFHTTLFMSNDKSKMNIAYARIRNEVLLDNLFANKFLIGVSPNGNENTYKVLKEINVKQSI